MFKLVFHYPKGQPEILDEVESILDAPLTRTTGKHRKGKVRLEFLYPTHLDLLVDMVNSGLLVSVKYKREGVNRVNRNRG